MATETIKSLEHKLKILRNKPNSGATGRKKVDTLTQLAEHLRLSDPRQAGFYAKKALVLAKQCRYRKGIGLSLLNLVWPHFVWGNYTEALEYAIEALRVFNRMGDSVNSVTVSKYIGFIYGEQCEYEKALKYLFKALKICNRTANKKGKAHVYMEIGNLYHPQGNYTKQMQYYLKALKIAESIDDKLGMALCHHNIGGVYMFRGSHKQALNSFFTALKLSREIGHKQNIASANVNIASIYEYQKKYKSALSYALKAKEFAEEIADKGVIARAYGVIAGCKKGVKGLQYQLKSLQLLEEIGQKEGVVVASLNVGINYKELKEYNSACVYLKKSLKLAREIGAKYREIEIYDALTEVHEARSCYKQALKYHRKKTSLEKELFSLETGKQMEEMKVKYETAKKEKIAEIHRLKNVDLRREIKERRNIEKELQKHRDQLEELVQERTAQLRSLAHELSLVEEKQRRKIATYLHDEVNQKLALAAFKLDGIEKVKSIMKIRKEHKEIKQIVDEAARLTRSLTFEISPPVLYEFGLESAIEWLVRQFGKQNRILCKFKDDGKPKPLTDDTRVLLFQSVRELLANVSRHASANYVKVSAFRDDNVIRIKVKDDGVGFDTHVLNEKIARNEGFGLFNLMERLQHMRGRLEIKSKKGQGTSVVIVAPLQDVEKNV